MVLSLAPVAEWFGGAKGRWGPAAKEWLLATIVVVSLAGAIAEILGAKVDRWAAAASAALLRPGSRAFAAAAGPLVVWLCALLSWYCFGNQPATGDEMSMRFQARLIASGMLFAQPELHRDFFNTPQALELGGRWFSQFPIGWPLVLAPGLALGIEWLAGPLFAGLTAALFYRFASRVGEELFARVATVLLALSPWVLFLGATQGSHVPVLALTAAALAALPTWTSSEDRGAANRSAAVIGFSVALAATMRPYDAVLVAAAIGAFQIAAMKGTPRLIRSLPVQAAAGVIPLAILLYANARTTGDPLLFAYDALNGPEHRPGFHLSPRGFVHTPLTGLIQTAGTILRLNTSLFEWPIPAVTVVAAGMLLTVRANRWDMLLLGLIATVFAGYFAYWSESYFARGPRFLVIAAPALVWFALRAPAELMRRLKHPLGRRTVLLVFPLAVIVAWRPSERPFKQSGTYLRARAMHNESRLQKLDVEPLVAGLAGDSALIFVPETWRARLLTRLRVLGLRPSSAGRMVDWGDACVLQEALDDEDGGLPGDPMERILAKAMAAGPATPFPAIGISLSTSITHDPSCLPELQRDTAAAMPFAAFLAHQRFDSQGRLVGPAVFAIDHGRRNELLRARFGDRAWYRLTIVVSNGDTALALVPYARQ